MSNRKDAKDHAISIMKNFARGILKDRTDVAAVHRDDLAEMVARNTAEILSDKELDSLLGHDSEVVYQSMLGMFGKCRQTATAMLQPTSTVSH